MQLANSSFYKLKSIKEEGINYKILTDASLSRMIREEYYEINLNNQIKSLYIYLLLSLQNLKKLLNREINY